MRDSLTAEEAKELERYIDDPSLGPQLQNSITEEANRFEENGAIADQDIDAIVEGLENRVQQRLDKMKRNKQVPIPLYWRYAAAIIVVFLSVGLLFYPLSNRLGSTQHFSTIKDIPPGTNKATLVLANGKSIALKENVEGINVTDHLIRYDDGTVLLDHSNSQYLKLVVPRAGKYKLKLSDGTQVWLNAASSLKYPSTFQGAERVVEVQGEAYFEVQHDSEHPFVVKTAKQTIKVLGTAFNINNYSDDKATTTLVHGKIALTSVRGAYKVLAPGDQAIIKGDIFTINKVNTQDYIAWKEDLIVLNDQDIHDVFRQLERWYDVEFVNIDVIKANKTLSGEIPRNTNLSAILQALEEQIHVKFEINGRRIMIKT